MTLSGSHAHSILLFECIADLLDSTNSEYITLSINNQINLRLTKDNASNHPLGIVNIPIDKINTISYDLSADQFMNRCFIFSNVRYLKMSLSQEDYSYQLNEINDADKQSIIDFYNAYSPRFIDCSKTLLKSSSDEESQAYEFMTSGICMKNLNEMITNRHSPNSSIIYVDSQTSKTKENQQTYFNFIDVNLKSKESIREGHEMEDFYDTSFYLSRLSKQTISACGLLTQLKMQFLIFNNTLNTYACENMQNIIKLFIKSKDETLVLNILEKPQNVSKEPMGLNQFYLLLVTIWEFMSWEMKLHFLDTTTWINFINKMDEDLINLKVTDDEKYIKYYNYMSEKIRTQLKSIAKEDDNGFLSDVKDLVYNFEPIDISQEEQVSDEAEIDPLYQDDSEQEYVEIYGSSEDEYAPAVASTVTYRKY